MAMDWRAPETARPEGIDPNAVEPKGADLPFLGRGRNAGHHDVEHVCFKPRESVALGSTEPIGPHPTGVHSTAHHVGPLPDDLVGLSVSSHDTPRPQLYSRAL